MCLYMYIHKFYYNMDIIELHTFHQYDLITV